jgi:hypothetical protein
MIFEEALDAMRAGKLVQRITWSDKQRDIGNIHGMSGSGTNYIELDKEAFFWSGMWANNKKGSTEISLRTEDILADDWRVYNG